LFFFTLTGDFFETDGSFFTSISSSSSSSTSSYSESSLTSSSPSIGFSASLNCGSLEFSFDPRSTSSFGTSKIILYEKRNFY
jgi:hypothetical protein